MGEFCHHLPVLIIEWWSSVDGVWRHPRSLWKQRDCAITSRDGLYVRLLECTIAPVNHPLFSDPLVGAQYRWSANFAPFAPRFWGLIQGA
jgi:hypothetical protein